MATVVEGNLACPRPTPCGECAPDVQTDKSQRTIVADWETVTDDGGCTISPALLPVVITVSATSREEALQAAAVKLQDHFGPSVEELYETEIERDWWFGSTEAEPLLRVAAIFVGDPELDHDDEMTTVIR
jgi:hypothetical protein